MEIKSEKTPFDWLENNSWNCDDLINAIVDNNKENEFNDYVEEMFSGQIPTECELNDFCRFNYDEICEAIGIGEDEDGDEPTDDE